MDILPISNWMSDDHPTNRSVLLEGLAERGVHILDSSEIVEVSAEKRSVRLKRKNVEYTIFIDRIILAAGYESSSRFAEELQKLKCDGTPKIHRIGDCVEVRDIRWAIREGYDVGTSI